MKFRAQNTFTFLFILSFLFANVSGGMLDGATKIAASKLKNIFTPSSFHNFPNKEVLKRLKFNKPIEKAMDAAEVTEKVKDYLENYLEKYGFIDSSTSPSNFEVESSIIKFQKFFNLKTTGKLDKNTADALLKRRCGVSDIVNTKSFKPWSTGKELKYFYDNKNLPNKIKLLFQNAFNRWSKVTGLKFTETMAVDNSNFIIAFINFEDGKGNMVGDTYINKATSYMFFDIEQHWVSKSALKEDDAVDLESFVMHQIGHLLGLEHSSVEEAIMYPLVLPKQKIELVNDDDLQKIQQIYGFQN